MALTTVDAVLAGAQPPQDFIKIGIAMKAAGVYHSHWYSTGLPGAGSLASLGAPGLALSSPVTGQFWSTASSALETRLMRFTANATLAGTYMLCDRLWCGGGINATSTASQAINSVSWPMRDVNGSTAGFGVFPAVEVAGTLGAGTPTVSIVYTNSDGTTGRTATVAFQTTSPIGTVYPFALQTGDKGVRSIQNYLASATQTSGTPTLIAYRQVAQFGIPSANIGAAVDMLTSGFPRIYNDSVLFLVEVPTATTATNVGGQVVLSQG